MVVLQRSWKFDLYCEQCVFVLCFICQSWFLALGTAGLDYKMRITLTSLSRRQPITLH